MPLPTCQCNAGLAVQQQLGNIYCALYEILNGGDTSQFVTLTGAQTVTGKLSIESEHFVGGGSTPGVALGPAAGAGSTISIVGNDTSGMVLVAVDGAPAANGILFSVTFATPFAVAPAICITPATPVAASSGSARVYVTTTATGFDVNVGASPVSANQQMNWQYIVIGK